MEKINREIRKKKMDENWEQYRKDAEKVREQRKQAEKAKGQREPEGSIMSSNRGGFLTESLTTDIFLSIFVLAIIGGVLWVVINIIIIPGRMRDKYGILEDVCTGIGHASNPKYGGDQGIHPTIGLDDGWWGGEYIPEQTLADSAESVELLLCVGEGKQTFIETCEYESKSGNVLRVNKIQRFRFSKDFDLREVASGELVATENFSSIPPKCPFRHEFPEDSNGEVLKWVNFDLPVEKITDWVSSYADKN